MLLHPRRRARLCASLALALIAAAAVAGDATGAQPGPTIDLAATPSSVEIGREVAVTLAYAWPHGWMAIAEPDPARDFASLFVTAFPPVEVVHTGEREERRWRLTVLAPTSGAWSLPRPTLRVRAPDGHEVAAQAPEVIIQVGTTAAPPQLAPPRPLWIRPRTAQDRGRRRVALIAGGVAVALIALALLARRRSAATTLPPHRRFDADLEGVAAAGDGKEAGSRLSVALRRYAGAIWSFDGPATTTREVAQTLRGRAPEDEARAIVRLLDELDSLRWSAEQLPPSQIAPLVEQARGWVASVQRRLEQARLEQQRRQRGRAAPATG